MYLILGFGETGVSFARYLTRRGQPFCVMDSRPNPPGMSLFKTWRKEDLFFGNFDTSALKKIKKVLVSPGIEFKNKVLEEARRMGIPIQTDIELFLEETNTKTILVTGTNGKTTVVSMIGHLLSIINGNDEVICSGNIGKPVLDTIEENNSFSVIEVSSFHLEHSKRISSDISVLLNIQPDHLDRHVTLEEYSLIKQKIFMNTKIGITGVKNLKEDKTHILNFKELLRPIEEEILSLVNPEWPSHEVNNVKAAVSVFIAIETMLGKLDINNLRKSDLNPLIKNISFKAFKRPSHRFEVLGILKGITFINDSKSTNVFSLITALDSTRKKFDKRKVILICGGVSKNQDFLTIPKTSLEVVKSIFIFGKDKQTIYKALNKKVPCFLTANIEEALHEAKSLSRDNDVILFSPACSSTDMFTSYEERGDKFKELLGFR